MFNIGDLVMWLGDAWSYSPSYGVIERIAREGVYTVRWFDDDSYNDYTEHNITLVSRITNV